MGAYESEPLPEVLYVDASRPNDSGDGESWATAKKTIQAAVDRVADGGTVWVTNGTYELSSQLAIADDVTVQSVNGPEVTAIDGGGSVRCAHLVSGVLSGVTLANGYVNDSGGGVWMSGAALNNCVLSGNACEVYGGGAYLGQDAVMNRCVLIGNSASQYGGGAFSLGGRLHNCIVRENTAANVGGVYLVGGVATLNNCTVTDNSSSGFVGGVCVDIAAQMNNCIVCSNTADVGNADVDNLAGIVRYTRAADGVTHGVDGCITNDPLFVNEAGGDYRLVVGSPCLDSGNNDYAPTTIDLAGNARVQNGTVDMGAYEGSVPKSDQTIAGFLPASGSTFVATGIAGLSATASSGLPVTFAVAGGPGRISNGTNLSFFGGGTVVVTADQAGDARRNAAPTVTNTFSVVKAAATVALDGLAQTYDGTARAATCQTSPTGLTVVVTYDGNSAVPAGVGNYAVAAVIDEALYAGSATGTLSVATKELTVDGAVAQDKAYDGHTDAVIAGGALVGVVSGDDVTLENAATGTFAQAEAGTDIAVAIAMTLGGEDAGNYALTQPTLAADILKADQSITNFLPADGSRFGFTDSVQLSADGGPGSPVTFAVVSGPGQIDGDVLTFRDVGAVTVSAGQAESANYNAAPTVTHTFIAEPVVGDFFADALRLDDSGDGLSWATAKKSIQAAVDLAADGSRVWVTNGVYALGGAVAPGAALSNRVCVTRAVTVCSVNGAGATVIRGRETPGGAAVRCAYLAGAAVLRGFTLSDGCAEGVGEWNHERLGGGAYLDGGGSLVNCMLTGNTAAQAGGGAYLHNGGTLDNCELSGNSSGGIGGGAFVTACATLNNCTVSANAAELGGGIYLLGGTVNNCVVWDNTAAAGWKDTGRGGGVVRNTCSSDGVFPGVGGCITNAPLFADPANGDFRLLPDTPCFDGGDNAYAPTNLTPFDLYGNARIFGSAVDMGAHEVRACTLTVVSAHGEPEPSGVRRFYPGTCVTNAVPSPARAAGTQHVCVGWTVVASDPVDGTGTTCVVTITNDMWLTWNWATNYWLDVECGPHGSLNVRDGWRACGDVVELVATADPYYHFAGWSGDMPASPPPPTMLLAVHMHSARIVRATFAENLAPQGTPEWWLAQHGASHAFGEAELEDQDADGMAAWGEYIAGTDPGNTASVLAIADVGALYGTNCTEHLRTNVWGDAAWSFTNDPPYDPGDTYVTTEHVYEVVGTRIEWPSVTGRLYRLEYAPDLSGHAFRPVDGAQSLPATPPYNVFIDDTPVADRRFYRVSVRR